MRKVAHICFLLLILIPHVAAAANLVSGSTTIKVQVVVTESMLPQKCNIGFDTNDINLSQSLNNDCRFDSEKLVQTATQLALRKLTQSNEMQFVTITVTAP